MANAPSSAGSSTRTWRCTSSREPQAEFERWLARTSRSRRRRRRRRPRARAAGPARLGLRVLPPHRRHERERHDRARTSRTSRAGCRSAPGRSRTAAATSPAGSSTRSTSSRATGCPRTDPERARPPGAARLPGEPALMATTASVERLERAWAEPGAARDRDRDGRPQEDRRSLPRHRDASSSCSPDSRRWSMRTQLARAERAAAHARGLQPALLDARHHDDLPVRHADALGLRQLPRAADDRRARHGVPAAERLQLLGLPRLAGSSSTRAC